MVQFGRHMMHRGPDKSATGIQGPLVRVQSRERGQQRGMNIEQAPGVAVNKPRRENTHEAGQYHQDALFWVGITIYHLRQGAVENLP